MYGCWIFEILYDFKYQAASVDDEGIGVKIAGFAQFSSPKKHNGAAGLDMRVMIAST